MRGGTNFVREDMNFVREGTNFVRGGYKLCERWVQTL